VTTRIANNVICKYGSIKEEVGHFGYGGYGYFGGYNMVDTTFAAPVTTTTITTTILFSALQLQEQK